MNRSGLPNQRGVALVEASVAMALTIFVFLVGVNLMIVAYKAIALKYTLTKSLRWAVTGETLPNPNNPLQNLSRAESIELRVVQLSQPYALFSDPYIPGSDYSAVEICASSLDENFNCTSDESGSANEMLQITASIPLKVFFYSFNLNSRVVGKMEPFA